MILSGTMAIEEESMPSFYSTVIPRLVISNSRIG